MFVGHYAVALAAKKFSPTTSLGWTFLAVQFLDILWAPAILLGIEHARLVPGYLPASAFVLYDIPWTHGLLMAVAWAWLTYRLSKNMVMGACVFSHWVLDWVTHRPDLPLFRGGPVVGLGLWHFRHLTFLTETVLLLIGLMIYLHATRPRGKPGNYAITAFVIALILVGAVNLYGPVPPTIQVAAIGAELSYLLFAGIAAWVDRFRGPLPPEPEIRLGLADA